MALRSSLVAALALASFTAKAAAAAQTQPKDTQSSTPLTIPGAYIVEFEDNQDDENAFINKLNSDLGHSNVSTRQSFQSSIFKGVSFTIHSPDGVSADATQNISALPEVKRLWPVSVVTAPKLDLTWTAEGKNIADSRKRSDDFSYTPAQLMTQVDKLHALGHTGKGLRIGIIDTGVDYTHPALGGCFGSGCLVEYGKDLVGDDFDDGKTAVPDADPLDQCNGHGTHVSGIIAAMSNPLGFRGAAPDVKLGMYRVFGCAGVTSEDVMLDALISAFEDGSDIITGSVGSPSGFALDSFAIATSRIVAAGVPCTFAAGNEIGGTEGMYGISSPATGDGVMGISSFSPSKTPDYDATNQTVVYKDNSGEAGRVSSFTSWGPTYELRVKPNFGTPGGYILSTLPLTMGGYGVASGTSMATPLAASIVALISQALGTRDPEVLNKALMSTAKRAVDNSYSSGFSYSPVPQQGAGIAQAYDALHVLAGSLSEQSLSFNDSEHFNGEQTFFLSNPSNEVVSFNISHTPALSTDTTDPIYRDSKPEKVQVFASLNFEPSSVTLQPGRRAVIRVSAKQPEGLETDRLPMYSGWVDVHASTQGSSGSSNSTTDRTFSIPYVGVAAAMRTARVFAYDRVWMMTSENAELTADAVVENATFQLYAPPEHPAWARPAIPSNNSVSGLLAPGNLPCQWLWLLLGSTQVRLEAKPIRPTCDGLRFHGKDNGLGVVTLGNIADYPTYYHRPIGWNSFWDGKMADGTWAPAGRYQLSVFALRIFGDERNPDDWDRFDSVEFNIRYVKKDEA